MDDKKNIYQRRRSGRRFKYILGLTICAVSFFLIWAYWDYIPGTLRFDEEGSAFGTGVRQTFYSSGKLLGEEYYVAGVPASTIFYGLDGSVVAATVWDRELGGVGYGVDDVTGNIKMWFQAKYDAETRTFLAHGIAVLFNEDGSLKRMAMFKNGMEQHH